MCIKLPIFFQIFFFCDCFLGDIEKDVQSIFAKSQWVATKNCGLMVKVSLSSDFSLHILSMSKNFHLSKWEVAYRKINIHHTLTILTVSWMNFFLGQDQILCLMVRLKCDSFFFYNFVDENGLVLSGPFVLTFVPLLPKSIYPLSLARSTRDARRSSRSFFKYWRNIYFFLKVILSGAPQIIIHSLEIFTLSPKCCSTFYLFWAIATFDHVLPSSKGVSYPMFNHSRRHLIFRHC